MIILAHGRYERICFNFNLVIQKKVTKHSPHEKRFLQFILVFTSCSLWSSGEDGLGEDEFDRKGEMYYRN